ncbi:MAG: alpha/beta hydrolase [Acidobacteria bacterium]|nr:alpha/beta hydrolase [Acidobacteriota bacterium]
MIRAIVTAIAGLVAGVGLYPSPSAAPSALGDGQVPAPPLTHQYANVNGVRLHYARAGRGPLIVFLHGFPEFWYEWKNQIPEFSRDHTVVAPDMRGYNLSSKPAELSAYQIPVLVEDVRALADEILKTAGGSRFTLVAHDWGGVVAWVFAAQHPEMLDKLVIINAPHPTVFARELRENPAQQQASLYMLMFRSPEAEATLSGNDYARLTSMVLGAGLKDGSVTEVDKAVYLAAWSQPGALTGGLNYYRASNIGPTASSDARSSAASAPSTSTPSAAPAPSGVEGPAPSTPPLIVRVPTLVIWGDKDTALLTGNLNGLDQVVPALTVRHIPDATHWVVREKPDEVNRFIREFLAQP